MAFTTAGNNMRLRKYIYERHFLCLFRDDVRSNPLADRSETDPTTARYSPCVAAVTQIVESGV